MGTKTKFKRFKCKQCKKRTIALSGCTRCKSKLCIDCYIAANDIVTYKE